MSLWGRLGDCAPGQIDGQCGMATFVGTALGVLLAFIILVLGHLYLALPPRGAERRARPATPSTGRTRPPAGPGEARDRPP
jgi:hypothetical protein